MNNKFSLYGILMLSLFSLSQANEVTSGTLIQLSGIGSVVVFTSVYMAVKEFRRKKK